MIDALRSIARNHGRTFSGDIPICLYDCGHELAVRFSSCAGEHWSLDPPWRWKTLRTSRSRSTHDVKRSSCMQRYAVLCKVPYLSVHHWSVAIHPLLAVLTGAGCLAVFVCSTKGLSLFSDDVSPFPYCTVSSLRYVWYFTPYYKIRSLRWHNSADSRKGQRWSIATIWNIDSVKVSIWQMTSWKRFETFYSRR